jgi:hypothetical protein
MWGSANGLIMHHFRELHLMDVSPALKCWQTILFPGYDWNILISKGDASVFFSHRIFPVLLSILPALIFNTVLHATSAGQYWQPVYQIAGVVFALISAISCLILTALIEAERSRFRAAAAVFCSVILGWIAFACVMGLVNLTPLCVGQDNGDGNNDLAMCIVISILSTAVYTPLIFIGAGLCAGLAALVAPPTAAEA